LKQSKNDVKAKLERPGDVVSVPVNLTVPATRLEGKVDPQHDEVTAECRLVIRLSEADAKDSQLVDNIGFARGRAMITRYAAKRALSAGARPFHAVLLAGKLAGKGQLQEYAEKFLRYAEPPSHDDWEFSRGLGARYARGAGAKLGQFHEAVTAALAEYVAAPSSPSEEGPEILQRLFRLPKTAVGHKSTWRIVEPEVKIVGESIHVSATIALNRTRGTRILPKVAIAKESGIAHRCEWQSLESSDAAIDGTALVVDEGQKTVSFEGWARPKMVGLQLDRCAITIAVGVDDQESTNDA
jgi:hypothetical protein